MLEVKGFRHKVVACSLGWQESLKLVLVECEVIVFVVSGANGGACLYRVRVKVTVR